MEAYVRNQITIAENQSISIDFTAGRGANGLSATLDIRSSAMAAKPKPVLRSVKTSTKVEEEAAPEEADEAPEEAEADASGVYQEEEDAVEAEAEMGEGEEEAPAPSRKSIFGKKS